MSGEGEPVDGDMFAALDAETGRYERHTVAAPEKRGPGRPAGSPNRTTLQLQRYLMQRGYRDPAEFLAATVSADTQELARGLGCDPADALKIQRSAASDLLPYFHQRLPQQVEVTGDGARPLIMIVDRVPGGEGRVIDGSMSVHDAAGEQYQGVSGDGAAGSHGKRSHCVANDER